MSDQDGLTPEEMTIEELEASIRGEELPSTEEQLAALSDEAPNEEQVGEPEEVEEVEASDTVEQAQEDEEEIPEKYAGKSAEDLIKILQDQESYIGRLGNERTSTKREIEELRDRVRAEEHSPNKQSSEDFESDLRQGLEIDPAEAILKYVDERVESVENRANRQAQLDQQADFENFYNEQVTSNPDFLRRRENLDVVADAIKDMVKPEMLKSRQFIEMVDLISQASDMDYYVNEALSAERQHKETALNEKRQANTESALSQGNTSSAPTALKDMDTDALEQAIRESLAKD